MCKHLPVKTSELVQLVEHRDFGDESSRSLTNANALYWRLPSPNHSMGKLPRTTGSGSLSGGLN